MKIKFCGMKTISDIEAANALHPDYIGFVLTEGFKRTISAETAKELKAALAADIKAVGVFVDEDIETVAAFVNNGTIDIAQLHGKEDEEYIRKLRFLMDAEIIKAFRIKSEDDVKAAVVSSADHILLDAGTGEGRTFEWELIKDIDRPYILAGGLNPENIGLAVETLHPYGVDVSSGIETASHKDIAKMEAFLHRLPLEAKPD